MSEVLIEVYSDQEMQCPASYYGGHKKPWLTTIGDAERALSDPFTGEWTGSTFQFSILDVGGVIRAQLASPTDRYWTRALAYRLTSRDARAALDELYTAFVGPIVQSKPTFPRGWDFTLGDAVSQFLLSDKLLQIPWRMVRDGFLDQLDSVSDALDLEQPEPILYGRNVRELGGLEVSGEGFRIKPIYLGIETVDGDQYHCWLVCGHAVYDITIYVDGVQREESDGWLIPHNAGWNGIFGAPYVDKMSSAYGVNRRYTLVYGLVDGGSAFTPATEADRCALGEKTLTAAVDGVEDVGDGTGGLIQQRILQYKHFCINYVANQGPQSYQSGDWLDNPTYELIDGPVAVVDTQSFDEAASIAYARFPEDDGYQGSAAIGLRPGERAGLQVMSNWNRSCGGMFGITRFGRMRYVLVHPTEAVKAAAPLYTDAVEILEGSFDTDVRRDWHALTIHFRTDYDTVSGQWITSGAVPAEGDEITKYERDIPSEIREYPYAPGLLQATHLARIEGRLRKHPPRIIRLETTLNENAAGDHIAYRDLGDYIRYIHFDAVSETRSIRLAQILRQCVRGHLAFQVTALDVEDYIGFDEAEGS